MKIIIWLINKKIDFSKIRNCGLREAYKSNNINLVKLLIQQGVPYYKLFSRICKKNDTDLATWILDNNSNIYNNSNEYYNNCIIHQACETLSVEIVKLLFEKEIPIDFYENYRQCEREYYLRSTLIDTLIFRKKRHNTEEDTEKIYAILKLFLENGLDINKECCDQITYKTRMEKYDYLKQLLPCPSSIKESTKFFKHCTIAAAIGTVLAMLLWYFLLCTKLGNLIIK